MNITPLSFRNAKQLKTLMSTLPSTPPWQVTDVEIKGYPTNTPMQLFYRDPLECAKFLYANPAYARYMDAIPCELYLDAEGKQRYYTEPGSGKRIWHIQVM